MHDHTLRRTTNVQEVFPNRTDAPAAMFTWGELETLNAGAWFLHVSHQLPLHRTSEKLRGCYRETEIKPGLEQIFLMDMA
jgi:N-acetyl-anhydromuramyl-L-alanine amidase AmpD